MKKPVITRLEEDRLWLTLEAAADLEGRNRLAMFRKISTVDFSKAGKKQVPCHNGQKWLVHVSYLSPEAQAAFLDKQDEGTVKTLTQAEIARQTGAGAWKLAMAGESSQKRAQRLAKWVEEFMALPTKKAKWIFSRERHIPLRTLYHYAKLARSGGGGPVDPSLFICRRNSASQANPAVVEFIRGMFLQKEAPSPTEIHRHTAEFCRGNGLKAPSLATVYRWLKDPDVVNQAQAYLARKGTKAYRDKYDPTIRRDWTRIAVNGCWMGDHHQLDVFVVAPDGKHIVRPWVTTWLDCRSRVIAGHHLSEKPSSETIIQALRHGIFPKEDSDSPVRGMPQKVYIDNGKDYRSKQLHGETVPVFRQDGDTPAWGMLRALGITPHFAKPYSARSKSLIERSYGTLEKGWVSLLDGACGNKTENKPEKLERELRETQRYIDSGGAEGEMMLYTWEQFEAIFEGIIDNYHARGHGGLDGEAPIKCWARLRPLTTPVPERDTFDLLAMKSVVRQVQKDGIRITFQDEPKKAYHYDHPDLSSLVGQRVDVRFDQHMKGSVLVLFKEKLVCRAAQNNGWDPFAENEEAAEKLSEGIRLQKAKIREYRDKIKESKRPGLLPALGSNDDIVIPPPKTRLKTTKYDQLGKDAAMASARKTVAVAREMLMVNGKPFFLHEVQRERYLRSLGNEESETQRPQETD